MTDGNTHDDLTYLIIGATGGIGRAVAERLAGAGARVALMARTAGPLEELASSLDGLAVTADATDFQQVEDAAERARGWSGRLDGIVNAVGSILLKPAHLTREEDLDETLNLNVRTAFAAVRAGARQIGPDGGSVVLFSSAAATIGLANHEAIAAAKGAVASLARSAAATYAAKGLRFNAVAPGLVATPLSERILANDAARKASIALHPLGRIGEPADVVECVRWLLGPQSSWVTGQVIGVDGGLASLKTRGAG